MQHYLKFENINNEENTSTANKNTASEMHNKTENLNDSLYRYKYWQINDFMFANGGVIGRLIVSQLL